MMVKYLIMFWKTKQDRSQGFGDIMIETFNDLQKAVTYARRMVDKYDYDSVEVIDEYTETVLYGYDGIYNWKD